MEHPRRHAVDARPAVPADRALDQRERRPERARRDMVIEEPAQALAGVGQTMGVDCGRHAVRGCRWRTRRGSRRPGARRHLPMRDVVPPVRAPPPRPASRLQPVRQCPYQVPAHRMTRPPRPVIATGSCAAAKVRSPARAARMPEWRLARNGNGAAMAKVPGGHLPWMAKTSHRIPGSHDGWTMDR
jgi:hypothetical protein